MSLNDRDTENFPTEPPDSVLDKASTGLTQLMTKLHLNDVDTETLADKTHTLQLTLNDSNQVLSTMTDAEILGHTGVTQMMSEPAISRDHIITPVEQTSGVLSQVSESEGLHTFPLPGGRIEAKELEKAYGVIRSTSHTLFRLSTGRSGNRFLDETTRSLNIYIDGTHGSQNALCAFFIPPRLKVAKTISKQQNQGQYECTAAKVRTLVRTKCQGAQKGV